jgi:hypothetical protein
MNELAAIVLIIFLWKGSGALLDDLLSKDDDTDIVEVRRRIPPAVWFVVPLIDPRI